MRLKPMLAVAGLALAAATVTGCGGGGGSSAGDNPPANLVGNWGGGTADNPYTLARLSVTATGGHFDFICGTSADLSQPLQPDAAGAFSATGTITYNGIPVSPPPSPVPTRFVGTVRGRTMTVTLYLTPAKGNPSTQGPYTLTFGQSPSLSAVCPA